MYFFFDPTFFLLIPALILAIYAQYKVKSTFAKFSKVPSASGLTGADAGRKLLNDAGLYNVPVERVPGNLTDNYDPKNKKLNLSQGVFGSKSVAAIGIAAHEVGHAIQDDRAYAPLKLRNNIVPVANLGTTLAFPLFFIGFLFAWPPLMDIGIIAFTLAVAFTVITLPVEFNASRRAVKTLSSGGYLTADELTQAKSVLNAAALTYVAATAMAVMNLLRLLILRGSRD
jgi:Zn-dependent membrane protease YugP